MEKICFALAKRHQWMGDNRWMAQAPTFAQFASSYYWADYRWKLVYPNPGEMREKLAQQVESDLRDAHAVRLETEHTKSGSVRSGWCVSTTIWGSDSSPYFKSFGCVLTNVNCTFILPVTVSIDFTPEAKREHCIDSAKASNPVKSQK
jgi:hypothetical protein